MEDKKLKVTKTIKIDPSMNDRLLAVCEHLGVNPHAYLISAVGMAISKDEVAYVAAKSVAESQAKMAALFDVISSQALEETEKNK